MMKHQSLLVRAGWVLLIAATSVGASCKSPKPYQPTDVDRGDGGQADARGGSRGDAAGPNTGGNGGVVPPEPDASVPVLDGPISVDAPSDLPPEATCVPNMSCTQGIGPCRQGATSCATPTSPAVCTDVGADDTKGGCTAPMVCHGGACVAPCPSSMPCTDGIKPCRKGATTCAMPGSPTTCADVGIDDSRGGCAGGQICSNGMCVQPCAANQPCTQGVGP